MTLCIAALCTTEKDTAATHAVVSCDSLVTGRLVASNIEWKLKGVGEKWSILYSGADEDYNEIIAAYHQYLPDVEKSLTAFDALELLAKPPNGVRERRANSVTQRLLKKPYDYFLAHGKAQLPEEQHKAILNEALRQSIDADVLLVGPIGGELTVFKYEGSTGRLKQVFDFAAIGSGAEIAEASIMQRRHHQFRPLQRALYVVYEAQRNGQKAPNVGDELTLIVIDTNGAWHQVRKHSLATLETLYADYWGPRDIKPDDETSAAFLKSAPGDEFYLPARS